MPKDRSFGSRLRSLLNLLLLVALIATLVDIAWQAAADSRVQAERRTVEREARRLHQAMLRYYDRHQAFPNASTDPRLDPATLDPLRELGYYDGILLKKLRDGRVDAYDSPDDTGLNQEFWFELTPAVDDSVRYIVARSNDAPSSGCRRLDGVYRVRNGRVEALR